MEHTIITERLEELIDEVDGAKERLARAYTEMDLAVEELSSFGSAIKALIDYIESATLADPEEKKYAKLLERMERLERGQQQSIVIPNVPPFMPPQNPGIADGTYIYAAPSNMPQFFGNSIGTTSAKEVVMTAGSEEE